LLVAGCGSRIRSDWDGGAGGAHAPVTILNERGAVELAIWEGAILYDLRDYQDWMQGNISGARRITLDDIERGKALPLDRDAPVLFFGDGPRDIRPELAAEMALERGHTNVMLFPGGWRGWAGMHVVGD
jgi:rhodanese-related sulfurtransferase